jgi:1,4-alpha-glucan branching enzyme
MRGLRRGIVLAGLLGMACTPPGGGVRSPEIVASEGVVFRFRAPAARVVQLAGSWDGNLFLRGSEWTRDTRIGLMEDPDRDGVWELRLPLGPGRYQYRFLVDGRFWELDPSNPQRAPDGSGGLVSLFVVP